MMSTFPYLRVQGGDLECRLHCWEKIFFTIKQSSQLWKKPLEMSPDQSWFLKSTAKYAFIKRRIVYIKRLRCVFSNKRSGVLHSRVENRSPGKLFLLVGVLRHYDHDGAREHADLKQWYCVLIGENAHHRGIGHCMADPWFDWFQFSSFTTWAQITTYFIVW